MCLKWLFLLFLLHALQKANPDATDSEYNTNDELINEAISNQVEKRRILSFPTHANNFLRRSGPLSPYISSVQAYPPGTDYANLDSSVASPNESLDAPKKITDTADAFSLPTKADVSVKDESATEKLVGDVNRYGLWEYTADNTDVGSEIKLLLKSSKPSVTGMSRQESLERQASTMNEKINRYLEGDTVSPTVDPMETPEGFDEKVASVTSSSMNKLHNTNGENVDIVTIPNSLSIEDEHGNQLAAINEKANDATQHGQQQHLSMFTSGSPSTATAEHDTAKAEASKQPSFFLKPSVSLTLRLLNALKRNKKFREQAKLLLESEEKKDEYAQDKSQTISSFVRESKPAQTSSASDGKSSLSHMSGDTTDKADDLPTAMIKDVQGEPAVAAEDAKLITIIKQLIRNQENAGPSKNSETRTQLNNLLSSLKHVEKEMHQVENDIQPSDGKTVHVQDADEHKLDHSMAADSAGMSGILDLDHPLGTEKGSPLMGYLEQESAIMTNIKDDSLEPRLQLQVLASMLKKQEHSHLNHEKAIENEANDEERHLLEAYAKLLKEGHSSDETKLPLKDHEKIEYAADSKEVAGNHAALEHESASELDKAIGDKINRYLDRVGSMLHNTSFVNREQMSTDSDKSHSEGDVEQKLRDIEEQKKLLEEKEKALKQLSKQHSDHPSTKPANYQGSQHEPVDVAISASDKTESKASDAIDAVAEKVAKLPVKPAEQMIENSRMEAAEFASKNGESSDSGLPSHANMEESVRITKLAKGSAQLMKSSDDDNSPSQLTSKPLSGKDEARNNEINAIQTKYSVEEEQKSVKGSKSPSPMEVGKPASTVHHHATTESDNDDQSKIKLKDSSSASGSTVHVSKENDGETKHMHAVNSYKNQADAEGDVSNAGSAELEQVKPLHKSPRNDHGHSLLSRHNGDDSIKSSSPTENALASEGPGLPLRNPFPAGTHRHSRKELGEAETLKTVDPASAIDSSDDAIATATISDKINTGDTNVGRKITSAAKQPPKNGKVFSFPPAGLGPRPKVNRLSQPSSSSRDETSRNPVTSSEETSPSTEGSTLSNGAELTIKQPSGTFEGQGDPPLLTYHAETMPYATISENDVKSTEDLEPNTIMNLLKHREQIPTDEMKALTHLRKQAAAVNSKVIRPIVAAELVHNKPFRHKMVDVTATRKSFGPLPRKPKNMLIHEIEEKLTLLASHHSRHSNRQGNFSDDQDAPLKKGLPSKPTRVNHTQVLLLPKHRYMFKNKSTNSTPGIYVSRNVLVPGSEVARLEDPTGTQNMVDISNSVDPADVTRSILPKTQAGDPTIEQVFTILGSNESRMLGLPVGAAHRTIVESVIRHLSPNKRIERDDVPPVNKSNIKTDPDSKYLLLKRQNISGRKGHFIQQMYNMKMK